MIDPRKYSICVKLSDDMQDNGEPMFKASVRELPDLAIYEDSFMQAYEGLLEVLGDLQDGLEEKGRHMPEPFDVSTVEASGRTTLRMSKSLHQQISEASAEDEISLNQWLVEAAAMRLSGRRAAPVVHVPNAISVTYNMLESGRSVYLNSVDCPRKALYVETKQAPVDPTAIFIE